MPVSSRWSRSARTLHHVERRRPTECTSFGRLISNEGSNNDTIHSLEGHAGNGDVRWLCGEPAQCRATEVQTEISRRLPRLWLDDKRASRADAVPVERNVSTERA